jgi:hypothetical protein
LATYRFLSSLEQKATPASNPCTRRNLLSVACRGVIGGPPGPLDHRLRVASHLRAPFGAGKESVSLDG